MYFGIRGAQLHKVPYMLVIGDREVTESAVAVRHRADGDLGSATVDAFIQTAAAEVRARRREAGNPQRGAA